MQLFALYLNALSCVLDTTKTVFFLSYGGIFFCTDATDNDQKQQQQQKSTTKYLPPCLRITEVFWAPCRQQRSQHYCVRTFAKVHLLSHLKLVPRYIVLHHCPDLSNIYLYWSKVNCLLFHNLCCNFIYLGPWMLVYPHVLGFKDSFSFLFFQCQ